MNHIFKNFLLGLTLVCVIAIIVFSIQLIVINSGIEPDDGLIPDGSNVNDPDDDNGDNGNDPENNGDDDPALTPNLDPQGMRHSFLVSDNTNLVIFAKEELFDFEENDLDWWFLYTGGGIATLEIRHLFVTAQSIAIEAEVFLNNYTDGALTEYLGLDSIRGSFINGHHARAEKDGTTYEVWIHDLVNSDLALVFVISYENNEQRDALYEMLNTMRFE
ncbi:MAG: hypothetical protein LBC71_03730 [Oscillospiraceae bacterium]|jgi:hypothetical protein|nr:hypothetical protein [Oscillospiraceae bacterium]